MNAIILGAVTALLLSAMMTMAGSLYDIPLKDIEGKETSLRSYQGKVLLVVNVASKCGFTRQYKPLEAIYRKYKDKGLVVLGFPCNDFGGQEPGDLADIKQFCQTKFEVSFPMFDKLKVRPGSDQHKLYVALTGKDSPFPGDIKWNFGKFLLSRDGTILARFASADEPDGDKVVKAIEAALAEK
jgi:glutathione peroxidase